MKNRYLKLTFYGILGAVAGFAYYYYIGCYNGQCLISSNPYISTAYGTAAGLVMGWDSRRKTPKKEKEQ